MEILDQGRGVLDGHALPRELLKWLQSLDLSYSVSNAKRDLSNGFVVAEIMHRYYPTEVKLFSYDNGMKLATKLDNWERLYYLFKTKNIPIGKGDFDSVIHCEPGAAVAMLYKLFHGLTKRQIPTFIAAQPNPPPAYMRPTASRVLKDGQIARTADDMERTVKAVTVLQAFEDKRRMMRIHEASALVQSARASRPRRQNASASQQQPGEEPTIVNEVAVKALSGAAANALSKGDGAGTQARTKPSAPAPAAVSAVGALSQMQPSGVFVRPAVDIIKPLVLQIIGESEEVMQALDPKKDPVVSFMELCRDVVPEPIAVKVFDTLASRATLLTDTLIKSPTEFWKMWALLFPALSEFSESQPAFEAVVYLFKRIGDLMREAEPALAQQLLLTVALPALAKEMEKSPGKREALCEVIYCYTMEDTANHLVALRALKERIPGHEVFVFCLSCLVNLDAQQGLLDEHLLDLYIYYAVLSLASSQPKIRVAGLSVISAIASSVTGAAQREGALSLVPNIVALAADDWWEVQAQLLVLCSHLFKLIAEELSGAAQQDGGEAGGGAEGNQAKYEEMSEKLMLVVSRIFHANSSKNVIQVGLSSLVQNLADYPSLIPTYVDLLVQQPQALRQRLLKPPQDQNERGVGRLAYVMGTSSRLYEERCICDVWPAQDVAKTFSMQVEALSLEHFELEHVEVFLATLPAEAIGFDEEQAEEWLQVFEKVKGYVFVALVDPELHQLAAEVVRRFWFSSVPRLASGAMESSKKTLLQALGIMYSGLKTKVVVEEATMFTFLQNTKQAGGAAAEGVKEVMRMFKEEHPAEFSSSMLASL